MKTKNWLLITSICTLTGAGLAAAQPGGPGGHGRGLFEKVDANKDGVVTSQEVESSAKEFFAKLDTNKDGKVTPEERKAAHEAGKKHHEQRAEERFEALDKNDNGALDREEVARMPDHFFGRLDTDKNGSLSYEEMQAFRAQKGHRGHGKGHHADPAGDKTLSQADFVKHAKERMQKLDANNDGKITQDEAKAHRGPAGHHGRGGPGEAKAR